MRCSVEILVASAFDGANVARIESELPLGTVSLDEGNGDKLATSSVSDSPD